MQSPSRRMRIGLLLALVLMGVTLPATFAAAPPTQPAPPINVRFPRLVLRLNESGAVEDLGVVVSEGTQLRFAQPQLAFLSSVLGLNLTTQMFDAATLNALREADIQHVQIQTGREGIGIYGNGRFLLGVEWGDLTIFSELRQLGELINVPFAAPMAQLVPAIDADVLIQLPTAPGARSIAARPIGSEIEFPARQAPSGEAAVVFHATGGYDADGTALLLGRPLADWGRLLGADLRMLNLDARAIPVFQEAGVQNFGVSINGRGASLLVNGEPVATVAVGDEESLEVAIRLAERFQVPFAEFIPLASRTGDLDIRATIALPAAR